MNNLFEKGKEALKGKLKKKILLTVIPSIAPALLIIFGVIIIVVMFMAPIIQALNAIESFKEAVAGFFEKTGNFLSGRGFREIDMTVVEAKEAEFNGELGRLYELYLYEAGVEINAPLILATVYYPLSVTYDEATVTCVNGLDASGEKCTSEKEQFDMWKEKIKKLPDLINHSLSQVITTYSCEKVTATVNGETVTRYVEGGQVGEPVKVYPFDGGFDENETCHSTANIKKYTYQAEEDLYDEYLSNPDDGYIVKSEEYKFPKNFPTEKEKQNRLDQIVISIHDLAELYDTLFKPPVIAQEVYGAIPYNILTKMVLPLDPTTGSGGKGRYTITSCFSPYRELSNGQKRAHHGIDVVPDSSADQHLRAAADGIVVKVVDTNNYNCYDTACSGMDGRGNYVIISHEIDGIMFETHYYHMKSVSVTVGAVVTAGDIIGVVGNTGNSSGTHLHFQYMDSDGNPVNPGNLFTNPGTISPSAGCSVLSIDCANRNAPVAISPLYGKWNGKSYPINVVVNGLAPIPLEQYILGVTINEVGGSFHIEAIKAQMVAARTYTFGSQRFSYSLKEAQGQIIINAGVASEATQTFNLNGLCSMGADNQAKLIQALEATRGQVLIADTTKKMFSSEYSSYAANNGYRTLGDGYVCKLPNPYASCDVAASHVQSYATTNNCYQNGRNICGHGRGMSQWGAQNMAKNYRYTYSSILTHFYYASISDLGSLELSGYGD